MTSIHFLQPFFIFFIALFRYFFDFSLGFFSWYLCCLDLVSGILFDITIINNIFLYYYYLLSAFLLKLIFFILFTPHFYFCPKKWIINRFFQQEQLQHHETHRFLCHIMTTVSYFWLKSKIYPEKVSEMKNNTFVQAISFINICVFRDIIQHFYLTQLICINNHLRKLVDSICCRHWEQI